MSDTNIVTYRSQIVWAMGLLAADPRTLFVGQNVVYAGAVDIAETLKGVPLERRIEFPIAEDLQMGVCIGLALAGWLPVCIYPRVDFLVLALNQLVNHLDKFPEMSAGRYKPKVIIRAGIGTNNPLDPGPQHRQDYTEALRLMLTNVDVVRLEEIGQIGAAYEAAYNSPRSTVLLELQRLMR